MNSLRVGCGLVALKVQVTKELASFPKVMGGGNTSVDAESQKGLYLHLPDGIIPFLWMITV